jgi:hypothetical protein
MANHHVQFNCDSEEGDNFGKDNEIIVNGLQEDGNTTKLDVHLGFLQVNHRYEIIVNLPKDVLSGHASSRLEPTERLSSIHCRLISGSATEDENNGGTVIMVEFFAHKEKLLKEEMTLSLPGPSHTILRLLFHARVLGRGKGTPLLKNGIRCIGVVEDEESEASDWQGFT